MSSRYEQKWRRALRKISPALFVRCPSQNFHWRWNAVCFCGENEHYGSWHGGIYLLKLKIEVQRCAYCVFEPIGSPLPSNAKGEVVWPHRNKLTPPPPKERENETEEKQEAKAHRDSIGRHVLHAGV